MLRVPSRTGHTVHLETSCFEMTARKQSRSMYFTDIMAIVSAVFSSYFLLFVTFGPTSPASQYFVYTVSGHSHTLDMAIHKYTNTVYAIAALFDEHRQRCHVDCSCILACRRSARGMCSMNTSSSTPLVGENLCRINN